jgi:hypothetical protein
VWLLRRGGLATEALTPVRVRRGCSCLEPLEHLHQLLLKHVEFSNLLLDDA